MDELAAAAGERDERASISVAAGNPRTTAPPSAGEPLAPVRPLAPGARVVVVAPSSGFDRADFEAGLAWLGGRYEVVVREDVHARAGFLAGDDARRLDELRAALADPDAAAVVAARGGYGATRLLRALPVEEVRAAGKLLVGFSDVTALHALWRRAGLRSLHAPMVCGLGRAATPEAVRARWIAAAEGAPPAPISGLRALAGDRAVTAPLSGGNLAVLTALCGTPHLPRLAGAALFVEDVGERPYRLDRMLVQLRDAGALEGVRGVVLGTFTECAPGPDGRTAEEVLAEHLGALGVPVLAGLRAGHVDDNLPLPLGARVTLDPAAGTLVFEEGVG
jgi:muramoyltetrapeptide carboxypeptidase